MLNIGLKSDNTVGASGEETAAEFNDHNTEIQNAVLASGQTLNGAISDQFAKALFINGVAAISFQENSPGANAANLTPITGASGLRMPDAYSEMAGAELSFIHTIPNTSNSPTGFTVNVGQTNLTYLGNQYLTMLDGSAIAPGAIFGYTVIRYNLSSSRWELVSSQGLTALNQVNPKNWIKNATGQICRRGSSFTDSQVLTDLFYWDLWQFDFTTKGGAAVLCSQQTLNPSVSDELPLLNEGCGNYMRLSPSGAGSGFIATDYFRIQQSIQNGAVKLCGGRQVTISFKARASVAGKKIGVNARQYYGVGGSADDILVGQSITLSGVFTKYTITLDTVSLLGKTIAPTNKTDDALIIQFFEMWGATEGNNNFGVGIAETFGAAGSIDITEIVVTPTFLPLNYYPKPYDEDLAETPDQWHYIGEPNEPAFINSGNPGGYILAAFKMNKDGDVLLAGTIDCPNSNPVFALPENYRPLGLTPFPSKRIGGGDVGCGYVDASGNVNFDNGGGAEPQIWLMNGIVPLNKN